MCFIKHEICNCAERRENGIIIFVVQRTIFWYNCVVSTTQYKPKIVFQKTILGTRETFLALEERFRFGFSASSIDVRDEAKQDAVDAPYCIHRAISVMAAGSGSSALARRMRDRAQSNPRLQMEGLRQSEAPNPRPIARTKANERLEWFVPFQTFICFGSKTFIFSQETSSLIIGCVYFEDVVIL